MVRIHDRPLTSAKPPAAPDLPHELAPLAGDPDVDDDVKGSLAEIAQDEEFLLALEEYVHRTRHVH